jgi:hypothetical protein
MDQLKQCITKSELGAIATSRRLNLPEVGAPVWSTFFELNLRLVAIAPSSDFVWSSALETTPGTFCAKLFRVVESLAGRRFDFGPDRLKLRSNCISRF